MYREAQKVLGKGLSPFTRFLLGFVSGLFGIVIIWLEYLSTNSKNPYGMYAFGIFCLCICLACITKGTVRKTIGRLIGATVFVLSLWLLYNMVISGVDTSDSRSEPSILSAILFFFAFGLPGFWYAVFAKFPINNKSNETNSPNK